MEWAARAGVPPLVPNWGTGPTPCARRTSLPRLQTWEHSGWLGTTTPSINGTASERRTLRSAGRGRAPPSIPFPQSTASFPADTPRHVPHKGRARNDRVEDYAGANRENVEAMSQSTLASGTGPGFPTRRSETASEKTARRPTGPLDGFPAWAESRDRRRTPVKGRRVRGTPQGTGEAEMRDHPTAARAIVRIGQNWNESGSPTLNRFVTAETIQGTAAQGRQHLIPRIRRQPNQTTPCIPV